MKDRPIAPGSGALPPAGERRPLQPVDLPEAVLDLRLRRALQPAARLAQRHRIQQLRATYPDARFFLSCDSADVSRRLHEQFPGAIGELCTAPGYNTLEGIRKGLIDLYLLARTDYILGSHYSSFSEMAARLHG